MVSYVNRIFIKILLDLELDLREPVGLEESRAACESVSVRSPLLPVTGLAVDVPIRSVTGDDRVQSLGAVAALEALPVPLAALGEHLFSCEDHAATAGAALARRGLDYRGVDHGGAGSRIAVSQRIVRVIAARSRSADRRVVQIGEKRLFRLSAWTRANSTIRVSDGRTRKDKTEKRYFAEEFQSFSLFRDLPGSIVQSQKNEIACGR